MAKVSQEDRLLFAFMKRDYGCPFEGKQMDPDEMKFQSPDFGFDNYLMFDEPVPVNGEKGEQFSPGWKYLQDFANPFPRF